MKALWTWLCKVRELPGPLRYLDVFKLRRFVTLKRVVIFVCVVVGLHTGLNVAAYLALESELARVRAAGIEMNLEKYNLPIVPDAENAAHLYRAAFSLLERPSSDEEMPSWGFVYSAGLQEALLDAELRARVKRYLTEPDVKLALDLLAKANAMPRCNWDFDYAQGQDTALYPQSILFAARPFLLRVRVRYLEGDQLGAVEDIRAILRLAERTESDRILFSRTVQCFLCKRCREAAAEMASAQNLPAETARELSARFEHLAETADITETLGFETAFTYAWMEKLKGDARLAKQYLAESPASQVVAISYPFRPLYRLGEVLALRQCREIIDLSKRPYYEVKAQLHLVRDRFPTDAWVPFLHLKFSLWLPFHVMADFVATHAETQAGARVAQVGLSLEAYRAQAGTYPDSLDALVPEMLPKLPLDPFSGRPFHYRRSGKEVVVYSVGRNGVDDGGLRQMRKDGNKVVNPRTDDIAWRISR